MREGYLICSRRVGNVACRISQYFLLFCFAFFQGLIAALMIHKPDDHIGFIQTCLAKAQKNPELRWDSFINDPELTASVKRKASSRSLFTENKPLPPIQDDEADGSAGPVGPSSHSKTHVSPKPLPPIGSSTSRVGSDRQLATKLKDTPVIFVLGKEGGASAEKRQWCM